MKWIIERLHDGTLSRFILVNGVELDITGEGQDLVWDEDSSSHVYFEELLDLFQHVTEEERARLRLFLTRLRPDAGRVAHRPVGDLALIMDGFDHCRALLLRELLKP